jgi:hypothetical protein
MPTFDFLITCYLIYYTRGFVDHFGVGEDEMAAIGKKSA